VLFETTAPELNPPGVVYGGLYLRDRRAGTTTIPARDRRGRPPRLGTLQGSLSPSGRFFAYCSPDPQIVKPDSYVHQSNAADPHPDVDVFVRDRRTRETRRLSTAWDGTEADDHSCQPKVADNGDAFFGSSASDLVRRDPNGRGWDGFLYDWSRGRLHRVPGLDAGWSVSAISGDGRYVVALSGARLADDDHNGLNDLYVLHRREGGGPGRFELLSQRAGGGGLELGCDAGPIDVSHDGRYVVGSCRDGGLFEPPIADKTTHLVLFDRKRDRRTLLNPSSLESSAAASAAVSDDGRTVAFGSYDGIYEGTPVEEGADVFVWRRGQGVALVSVGEDSAYRWWGGYVDLTGPGDEVLFQSDSELVPDQDPDFFSSNVFVVGLD
jgi:hypothetical protein